MNGISEKVARAGRGLHFARRGEADMRKWWMGAVLTAGWLAMSAAADAQTLPEPLPASPQPLAYPFQTPPAGAEPYPLGPPPLNEGLPTNPIGDDYTSGVENAFDKENPCLFPPRLHMDSELLFWFTKRRSLPTLVTSGSINDQIPGALGQPNTRSLVSGTSSDRSFHTGFRFSAAYDLCEDRAWSVQGSAFILETLDSGTSVSSPGAVGSPVIARPFFNGNTGLPDSDPVAIPGALSGTILIQQPQRLYGGDANLYWNYFSQDAFTTTGSLLVGGRYLSLDEKLLIGESLQDLPGLGQPGNSYHLGENFTTYNRFYGAQVGAVYATHFGPVTAQVLGKLGFGRTEQTVEINGMARINEPNGHIVAAANRALLVQPSNVGRFQRNEYSFVPEFSTKTAYEFNEHVRLGVGYDFLGWSNILRPSDQVDTTVNIQPLQPIGQVGLARPIIPFRHSDFWVQGVNLSLEFSF
jgi:Putative beta barrel porin-7 (BBP7)